MQIRRAKDTDEEALASIRRNAILVLAVPAMSMEQAEQWAARAVAGRIVRAIRDHAVWVAVDGAAIGWVEVDRDRVAALYVSPSCARRGVGSALLAHAETSIQCSGYATARLESSQNALDFYLRRGYRRWDLPDAHGAWPLRKELAAVTPNPSVRPQNMGEQMSNESARRVDVFFYGLFMDTALLREKGCAPINERVALVHDFALRLGQRATLIPSADHSAYGVVMSLSHDEIDALYSEASVSMYRPEAVLAQLSNGLLVPALCFNLPLPPGPDERNAEYATKLRALTHQVGFPKDYVASIR